MNQSNYWISLDINKIHSQLTLSLKQGETGRRIHISLTEDGRPYQIGEGCYAWLQAKKNNSINPMSHPCTIENNKVVYTVLPDTTSATGRIDCEIVLCSQEEQIIISASFSINIYNTVFSEIEDENKEEISTLTKLISDANTLITDVEDKLAKGDFNAGFAEEMNVTVKTGDAGSEASVLVTANSETPNTAKQFNFDFTIPKGEQGIQGVQGEKGGTGAKLISQVLQGQDENGGNIYLQTFDDGTTATFTAPRGIQGIQGEKGEKGDGGSVDLSEYAKITDLNGKVDKVTTAGQMRLYGIDSNGDPLIKQFASVPVANAIASYSSTKRLQTERPAVLKDCANKDYVDDTAGTKLYEHIFYNPENYDMSKFKIISTSETMTYQVHAQGEDVGNGETFYGANYYFIQIDEGVRIIKAEYLDGDEAYPAYLTITQGYTYSGELIMYADIDGNLLSDEPILTINTIGGQSVSDILGNEPQTSIGIEL